MSEEPKQAFEVKPAKYAKGCVAVFPLDNTQGFKGRSSRLAEYLRGRWSNREHAYIMSEAKARKLEKLFVDGYDASFVTRELVPPEQPTENDPELLKKREYTDAEKVRHLTKGLETAVAYLGKAVAQGLLEDCVVPASRALPRLEHLLDTLGRTTW